MKVVFIDTWTVGIGNFHPISVKLNKLGIENLLIHRGSFGAEVGRPKEELIDGLKCRDISYYKTRFVHRMLEKEKPDVIVMLTSFYILDRAIILSARALGIKTVFLMPGIREVDTDYIKTTEYETKFKKLNKISSRLSKLPKYFKYVLPNYFYSGLKNDLFYIFKMEPWKVLFELFLSPGKKVLYPMPSHEIHCDKALVFAREYKNFFNKQYGYPFDRLEVVGNPSLDRVFKIENETVSELGEVKFLNGKWN